MQRYILQCQIAIGRHGLQMHFHSCGMLSKGGWVALHSQTQIVKMVQRADALHPSQRPCFQLGVALCEVQVVPPHVRPAKSEQESKCARQFLVCAVPVANNDTVKQTLEPRNGS